MVVVGEPGCGKTTLLRKIAAQYARHNAVFYFDGSTITTYGAATPSSARDANGVLIGAVTVHLNQPPTVDWRNLVQVEPSSIPLYVIDANAYATQQYTSLLNALSPLVDSRRFKIAVTSLPNDVTRWLELTRERTQVRPGVCELPPLSLPKAYAYVAHRIRSSQPNQPDLLLTPDARLLIAYFGVGNPGRIAEFTAQLVSFARAASIHVLTSWEVWNVQFSAGEDASLAHLLDGSSRPEKWPTAPVLSLLNQCRKTCGLLQRRDTP
jgi:energy-coupling factor transporter ATP-binding protein EcfA2